MKRYPVFLIVLALPALAVLAGYFLVSLIAVICFGTISVLSIIKVQILLAWILLGLSWVPKLSPHRKMKKGIGLFFLLSAVWLYVVPHFYFAIIGACLLLSMTRTFLAGKNLAWFFGDVVVLGISLALCFVFFGFSLWFSLALFVVMQMLYEFWAMPSSARTNTSDRFWLAHQMANEVLAGRKP